MSELRERIQAAWQGRISGCQLGKPVELLSMAQGHAALTAYLAHAGALPLRDYVPLVGGTIVEQFGRASCRGVLERSEPDDDINYTVLALLLLEEHGLALRTSDVARAWLRRLPAAATFTAERAAYRTLLERADEWFAFGAEAGFDLADCANNEYKEWIGAQIRADLYGWVCPGRPALAADLARRDAALSHFGDGVHGAAFVAAVGATIPGASSLELAVEVALREIPSDSAAAEAVRFGGSQAGNTNAAGAIRERYADLSPVHTVNNLALVVWALLSYRDDFGAAVGEVVAAGLDTDCNGATVGGLWGLQGKPIPAQWTTPWRGRVAVSLAGLDELRLDDLVNRTHAVAERIARES
ncbi:MAG: ADP-ribosylglycohydrolase family protein [Deltaproteobacteria bacterium]|nr:ADP-ribosylglycohydrolase family protein [Deltaproteobacteria bacterium]